VRLLVALHFPARLRARNPQQARWQALRVRAALLLVLLYLKAALKVFLTYLASLLRLTQQQVPRVVRHR
jgi:hypothetical protein